MLNEASNRSLSDQHMSQAEMMAMPTAGGEVEPIENYGSELRNLNFDNKQLLNNSSSMQMRKKNKRSALSGNQSQPGSGNQAFYENERRIYQERKKKVINDEEFIKKVQQFNSYMDKKKSSY
jgi:hypothetical protein